MKLHEVPRGTPIIVNGEELFFDHLDGMYSVCLKDGKIVHLAAWTEVKIKENHNV